MWTKAQTYMMKGVGVYKVDQDIGVRGVIQRQV
jgi:hypothetical protein